jgi:hypothetical protein
VTADYTDLKRMGRIESACPTRFRVHEYLPRPKHPEGRLSEHSDSDSLIYKDLRVENVCVCFSWQVGDRRRGMDPGGGVCEFVTHLRGFLAALEMTAGSSSCPEPLTSRL